MKQTAPGAACWKKKTGDQSEPWPPPACCAARDPGAGVGGQRPGTSF